MIAGSRRVALQCVLLAAAIAAAMALHPLSARAAFDLRRASPEALGSASIDLPFDPLEETDGGGVSAAVSHAAWYEVEGLAFDRVSTVWGSSARRVEAACTRVGTPDLAEWSQSVEFQERAPRVIVLGARFERIAWEILGEAPASGFAAGGGATARLRSGALRGVIGFDADRAWRSRGATALGAAPSAIDWLSVHAAGMTVAVADRWERSGLRSPRIAAEMAFGQGLAAQ
jgi:hypothetical protein